jgi:predicted esterase
MRSSRLKQGLVVAAFTIHVATTLTLLCLPCLLLFHAETGGSRLVGAGSVLLLVGFLGPWLLRYKRTRLPGAVASGFLLVLGLILLVSAWGVAPTGVAPEGNLRQVYAGEASFRPFAWYTVVPEIDQLKLGLYFVPWLDRKGRIDSRGAWRVRRLLVGLYREMRRDPAFVEVGSALGMCYDDFIHGRRPLLHFYEYVPRHLGREVYPVLVFLHGGGGNLKAYAWILKELADAEGVAVVAPTYGFGSWAFDEESAVLAAVHDHCTRSDELDEGTVYLAGLSNGGSGVTRGILNCGYRYAGFMYISPRTERDLLSEDGFAEAARGRPFLIIHGEEDKVIPVQQSREAERILREHGLPVTGRYYPDEDHFLVFERREELLGDIGAWMKPAGREDADGSESKQEMPR